MNLSVGTGIAIVSMWALPVACSVIMKNMRRLWVKYAWDKARTIKE